MSMLIINIPEQKTVEEKSILKITKTYKMRKFSIKNIMHNPKMAKAYNLSPFKVEAGVTEGPSHPWLHSEFVVHRTVRKSQQEN